MYCLYTDIPGHTTEKVAGHHREQLPKFISKPSSSNRSSRIETGVEDIAGTVTACKNIIMTLKKKKFTFSFSSYYD